MLGGKARKMKIIDPSVNLDELFKSCIEEYDSKHVSEQLSYQDQTSKNWFI